MIAKETVEDLFTFPTSYAQQRLWFLDQLVPGSAFYNIPAAVSLPFEINVVALEKSLNEIVRRHESLRTTFAMERGLPVQIVWPHLEVSVPVVELRNLPEAEGEATILRLAMEEARLPFNLVSGPLIRTRLLHLGPADYVFLLTIHHIVADAWSMNVFFQELTALYPALATGRPSPLPELPVQYADFAVWQREWLQGDVLEKQLKYWRQRLADLPMLQVPTDRPRPAEQTYHGSRYSLELPADLTAAARSLSQREGTTLFMTLLAAFKALLVRYTRQEDIAIGSPIANRNRSEIEPLIGFFVNMLVLRTDCSGNPTFRELLARVRQTAVGAYAHQDLPFEMLVEMLQPERDLSRSPLFQVIFQVLNTPGTTPKTSAGLTGRRVAPNVHSGTSKVDIQFDLWESPTKLVANIEYNTDLFDEETMARMAHHYQRLLEEIVTKADQPLSRLGLLTAQEQYQILVAWNLTRTDYHRDSCIHECFEAQAERTPDSVAIIFKDTQLTYRELDAHANQLAHHLQALSVGRGSLVAVHLERSATMIVALLAILKAGGAYVPLDPSYPIVRLGLMLKDSRAQVILTQPSLRGTLPESGVDIVCVERDWPSNVAGQSITSPHSKAMGGDLAYVIYTSGSTGEPKGVCVPHRAVIRLVENTNYITLGPAHRVAQASNVSFDAATFEIWGALLNGGTLVITPQEVLLSPQALAAHLAARQITTIFLTTSLFNQMAALSPTIFADLCHVVFGGEAVDPKAVQHVLEHGKPQHLINGYGPTETTTFAVCHNIERLESGRVPIGRPIANTQVYVFDPALNPVPVGVAGELYIGGDGLAHGYLNQPESTAARFVPDPFNPGDRLYKTGDLVRYLPDGNLEFLGRLDEQVKIRGFRIELTEIEAALRQHPQIRTCLVLARDDVSSTAKRLVGYIVAHHETSLSIPELRRHLKRQLPEFMIPAAFVFLKTMPLTSNGKVDREALPEPDSARPELEQEYVGPRSPVEEQLARLWAEVLSREKIGVYDNFFDSGGHSLLATQLLSRIRESFQIELPVHRIFETPTVAGLADHLESLRWATQGAPANIGSAAEEAELPEEGSV
jgi:amino acid adenylation domain-containing protein